jgi:hypothetical protein
VSIFYFTRKASADIRYILLQDRIDASSDIVGAKISSYAQYLEISIQG